MNINDFQNSIYKIQKKTIALVYIFENEKSVGYGHYDIWKSDVISEWILAIQEIDCKPLILDARTFAEKAFNKSLPQVDAVINLNNGNVNLSTLALIPSICSFMGIPCVPCNATSIISGENKFFSNCIAEYLNLNVPQKMSEGEDGIFRSLNFGSSRGTYKTNRISNQDNGFYQKFICGYDITTPLLYNPITEDLEVLPTVMYYPTNKNTEWFFNENVKEKRGGYNKTILAIDNELEKKYKEMAKSLQINTFCRIDARVKTEDSNSWDELLNKGVSFESTYFVEINPMPTIKQNINFHNSILAISDSSKFFNIYNLYIKEKKENASPTGFILTCSLLSIL